MHAFPPDRDRLTALGSEFWDRKEWVLHRSQRSPSAIRSHEVDYDSSMTKRREPEAFESMGLYRDDGSGRPMASDMLCVPKRIELNRGSLRWQLERGCFRRVAPTTAMFAEFLKLADSAQDNVLAFARHWGVLELCEHGQPASHAACGLIKCDGEFCFEEPIEVWQRLSAIARSILHSADRVKRGLRGSSEDWKVIRKRLRNPS